MQASERPSVYKFNSVENCVDDDNDNDEDDVNDERGKLLTSMRREKIYEQGPML